MIRPPAEWWDNKALDVWNQHPLAHGLGDKGMT